MAQDIPTITTDDLLDRIASGWRHAPAATEPARSAIRRFGRPVATRPTAESRARGSNG